MVSGWKWRLAQFSELKWWRHYLKNKDVKEYLNWKQNYWRNLLGLTQISISEGSEMNIWDAGCGPAGIFTILDAAYVTASDPLLNKYESEIAHFSPSDYPNTEFKNVTIEEFESKEKFELIFCMNAINHVIDIEACVEKLIEYLKPNGQLIITIDAHNHAFFKHLFRLLPGDVLHPHQYDLTEYKKMLTSRGLEIREEHHLKQEFFFDHFMIVASY